MLKQLSGVVFFVICFFGLNGVDRLSANVCPIEQHKALWINKLSLDPNKRNPRLYPLDRVARTVFATDSDSIPKVPFAGEILSEQGILYQLMHNGVKILKDCYYDSWMTDIIYGLRGHHEPQEERAFYEVLKYMPDGACMIELGAYWAYYSLWFATKIPHATNYLIEPCTGPLEIGKKNFSLNNKQGHFYRGYIDIGEKMNAPKIGIDTFLEQEHIEHVHLLHADIQGAEYKMLQSAVLAIQNQKIDYIFVSTHSDLLHEQCLTFLKEHEFQILAHHTMAESCSVDGLIVAKRGGLIGLQKVLINTY